MKKEIVIASGNKGKIKEAQENFLKCVLGDELWDAIFGNN